MSELPNVSHGQEYIEQWNPRASFVMKTELNYRPVSRTIHSLCRDFSGRHAEVASYHEDLSAHVSPAIDLDSDYCSIDGKLGVRHILVCTLRPIRAVSV